MPQRAVEVNPGDAQLQPSAAFSRRREKAHVLRRLVAGFTVILALLGVDGLIGFWGAKSVRTGLEVLTQQQLLAETLIEQLQKSESTLYLVEYDLSSPKLPKSISDLRGLLGAARQALDSLFAQVPADDPDKEKWQALQAAAGSLTDQIGRALDSRDRGQNEGAALVAYHEKVFLTTHDVIRALHLRSSDLRDRIDEATWRQTIEDRMILGACVLVASLFLVAGTRIYRRMTEQSEQLEIVSWQLLERQESLAQRLSRDLHDELGQSLTALKTNLSGHAKAGCADPAWLHDCTELLKGSIRSAHEISQLLRPTLLDDFGLDCALAWLCEKFEERHKVKVTYRSDFHWRLDAQAETQVFRIAQEALTNVARHAEATAVMVSFSKQDGIVELRISDNGRGMRPRAPDAPISFGLTGMKARAHSLGGELQITSSPGQGVSIEMVFPTKQAA
jgi:signal transduction histidine kinase